MSPSLLNIKHYRHISSPNRVEASSKKQHWNVSFIQDVDTIKTRNFLGTPEHKTDSIFWHHIWHHIHINTKFPVDLFSFHKLGGKTSFCTLVIFVCSFSETFQMAPKSLPICYLKKLQVVQLWYKTISTPKKNPASFRFALVHKFSCLHPSPSSA